MKNYLKYLISILFVSLFLKAHSNYSPEIQKVIKGVKAASYLDTVKMFEVGNKAIKIIRASEYKSAEAEIYVYYANYFYYSRDLDRVKKYLELSEFTANKYKDEKLSLFAKARLLFLGFEDGNKDDKERILSIYDYCKEKGYYKTQVEILNLLGNVYEESNQSDKAVKCYIEGIALAEKNGFEEYPAKFKNNLGLLKLYTGSLDEALNDFESGLKIAKRLGEQRLQDHIRINIAVTYFEKKEMTKAITLYEEVIQDLRKNDIPRELASTFINLASSLFSIKKIDLGKEYLDSAIQVLERYHLDTELTSAYMVKADYLLSIKNNNDLLIVLKKIKELVNKTDKLNDLSNYYLLLYKYEFSENDFKKALDSYLLHIKMRDSLDGIRNEKLIKELQFKYNIQEKEVELQKEKSKSLELEKQNQEERFIKWFLVSLSVVIIILVATFFAFRYSRKLRENQQLFSRQLIDSIEEERKRISQDLHDDIGQSLSIVKSRITKIKGQSDLIDENLENEVGRVIEQTRQISHSLYPSYLEKIGLVRSVARLLEKFQNGTNIECSFDIDEKVDELILQIKTHLYRIIQECVNNTFKHSGATALKITIEHNSNKYTLTYQDNGKGLSKENIQGLGLLSIKERAKIINAHVDFPERHTKGYKIVVSFKN